MYGELPSDLRVQYLTKGAPPPWFRPLGPYFFREFYGLGETSMKNKILKKTPLQIIRDLINNQEMPKNIPSVAKRYTRIDPLSPMFRTNLPKYGFGDIGMPTSILGLLAILGLVYYIFIKK